MDTHDATKRARPMDPHSPTMIATAAGTPTLSRLTPDVLDATLNWLTSAIRGDARDAGAAIVRRLRTIVDESVPVHPSGPVQLGALPDVVGTVVTLQYPLVQLELFLSDAPSDITSAEQAELYLTFLRYHLCKLELLLRDLASA
jgi:hypothetical protein